ncbi:hypothetical protein G6F20_011774 [Rhizopus arrhizus]|nr:hypothetical protein G6F20_011774 [Rhizopus arrhizus]
MLRHSLAFHQLPTKKILSRAFATATAQKVTLIPGDGVGHELAESVKAIFKASNAPVEWEQFNLSGHDSSNDDLMKETLASLRRNKVGLKGILYTPVSRLGHASFNVSMRKDLDIYASISLVKNIPGVPSRFDNVDLAIVRENTEGEYSGLEHQSHPGVVESLKIVTRRNPGRIAGFAFYFALNNPRKKGPLLNRKLGDGLFLRTVKDVYEKEYSQTDILLNDMIVDNASMQLVSRPQQFDVVVLPNLYGNILSNVGAGLIGGPGLIPGSSIGREYAVFEPGCRHVGQDIGGSDIANPTAMILSSVMMLRHLGLSEHANLISNAVYRVIQQGQARTRDMGGQDSTSEFTKAIISSL